MVVCAVAVAVALLTSASVLHALDISQCIAPLGVESGLIPDKDITASSCYNDGNVAPQNGRLNQDIAGGAWCPRSQITTDSMEWLEVELRGVHVVTAASTQGRFGNGQGQEFAEAYMLEYWRPRLGKWVRYRTAHGDEILPGNTNTYLVQKNQLSPPIWASKVRFIPHSSHRRTVCMRVELYGCLWNVGIVSYSMPQGDKRSSVELVDALYDGSWEPEGGGELRGGLGQLVDGTWGGDEIREGTARSAWVGWRNDSRPHPPRLLFEFDRVREFTALHIYCNNKFMRDVQVFSSATVSFSVGGRQFQQEPVRYSHAPDTEFESSRNVSIALHHRIGRWVRIELHFAARWILVSEVVFDSDVAQGNHTPELIRPPPRPHVEGGAGAGGVGVGGGAEPPVSTARDEDPVYVAVVVGVVTALAILLAVAVFLVVHRHRHRKCFASPIAKSTLSTQRRAADNYSGCGTSSLPECKSMGGGGGDEVKCSEYQEPYQALQCEPYFSYSTVLLEMDDFGTHDKHDDEGNYEYAVPELSCAPLLQPRALDSLSDRVTERVDSLSPHSHSHSRLHPHYRQDFGSLSSKYSTDTQCEAVRELRLRLETSSVVEFPRHRLRMISKLAEGVFGTVYVAEAEGVPEYSGGVCAEKRLVAVKFLTHDADSLEREEFSRDVRILSCLAHPCLARVLGVCRAPPPAVVLEYLEGGDLCRFLRAAALPVPLAALLHVATQVAAGMHYLESLNFVHRDLAARNCLIGPGYQIKISDFGTDNEAYQREYCRVGGRGPLPLRWASWEAVLAARHSTRADVWAFGVTLHEVFSLCRRRPYEGMSDAQVLQNLAHLRADDGQFSCLPRAPLCPRDVYEFMRECWRRDELARPTFRQAHALLQRHALAPPPPPPS